MIRTKTPEQRMTEVEKNREERPPWEDEFEPGTTMNFHGEAPEGWEPIEQKGGITTAKKKRQVSIRLDEDIVEHFKRGGRFWQSRINEALRALVGKP